MSATLTLAPVASSFRVLNADETRATLANSLRPMVAGFRDRNGEYFRPLLLLASLDVLAPAFMQTGTDWNSIAETLEAVAISHEFVLADDAREDMISALNVVDSYIERMATIPAMDRVALLESAMEAANSSADGSRTPMELMRALLRRIETARNTLTQIARQL